MRRLIFLLFLTLVSKCIAAERERPYRVFSCTVLDSLAIQQQYGIDKHVEWLARHCPANSTGEDSTECSVVQSRLLKLIESAQELEREQYRRCGGPDEP